jgi:HEAT repeat protein
MNRNARTDRWLSSLVGLSLLISSTSLAGPVEDILRCTTIDRSVCAALESALQQSDKSASSLTTWLRANRNGDAIQVERAGIALSILGGKNHGPLLVEVANARKSNNDLHVQLLAAAARVEENSAVGPLIDALGMTSVRNRIIAVGALGLLHEKSAVAKLVNTLADSKQPRLQAAAAQALGMIGDESAIPALLNLAGAKSVYVPARVKALDALTELKSSRAVITASMLIDHPTREIGRAALRLLVEKPAPFLEPVIAFALQTPMLRGQAARATITAKLTRLGPALIAAAIDPSLDPSERSWVLQAIGAMSPPGASPALLKHFVSADKAYQIEILKTLPDIGDRTVIPILIGHLPHSDHEVDNYVVYALENLSGKRLGNDIEAWREHAGLSRPASTPP